MDIKHYIVTAKANGTLSKMLKDHAFCNTVTIEINNKKVRGEPAGLTSHHNDNAPIFPLRLRKTRVFHAGYHLISLFCCPSVDRVPDGEALPPLPRGRVGDEGPHLLATTS